MSTKTISKRVALATVVALGAGVLSLVSVSSASATANNAATSAGPTAVDGVLNIAGGTNNTGAGVLNTNSYALAGSGSSSFGLLAVSDIAGTTVAGTTQTATLTSSGALVVYSGRDTANTTNIYSVTGGTVSGASTTTTATIAYNSSLTAVAVSSSAATAATGVIVKPNAGVSSMVVSLYTTSGAATSTMAATPANYTLAGTITVSIAATSTSGTLSLTNSKIIYLANSSATTTESTAAGIGTSDYATVQFGEVILRDAYSVTLPTGNFLQASATNGAYVALATSGAAAANSTAGTASTSYVTTAGTNVGLTVGAGALAATGGSTVVTVSYNGTVIGTKSYTFTGKIAKVTLSAAGNGYTANGARGNKVTIALADSSGNAITWVSNAGTTAYPAALTKNPNSFKGFGIGLGTVTWPSSSASGYFYYTCTQNMTDSVQVDYANADGTLVTSNAVAVSCSGIADSYTAKLDKAKYLPGDIATLTVTFKDIKGALAADIAAGAGGIADGTTNPTVTGSQITPVVTPDKADYATNGVKTYQFVIGTTSGSYQAVVSFPQVNAQNGANQTVSYTIADGSTSLNDVLKGIVSLIASINKQIAALAKLVTKK
jgi:hypothetical protein